MSITVTISCPHCGETDKVIRFGTNRSGTARCRCHACGKTFTLHPKSLKLSPEKEAVILNCLAERISQRGIARSLHVSRLTIRTLRKKTPSES
jgi:transposase-like protein